MRLFYCAWRAVLLGALLGVLCAALAPVSADATIYEMTIKSAAEAGRKCVSTSNGPFTEGMRIFIWECDASLAQTLIYDDQSQQLRFGANCAGVLGSGNLHDAIAVTACNGRPTQRWSMTAAGDNYRVVGVNNLCLNISNGVMANGTPLEVAACAPNSAVQLWTLYQASGSPAAQTAPGAGQGLSPGSNAVQTIFERRGLMGTFAEDCGRDPSDSNQYIVHRALDAMHIERDQMKSRTARSYAAVVDSAEELSANDIGMNISITEAANAQIKDSRIHLVTRIDGNRIRLMESGLLTGPHAGQTNIFAGRAANGGGETRWLNRCR